MAIEPKKISKEIIIDYTNHDDPVLKIPYSAIAGSINWGTVPTKDNENLEPWITAILQSLADVYFQNPNDESINIVISPPTNNSPVRRNGIDHRKNVRYIVTVYSTETIEPVIKGDSF